MFDNTFQTLENALDFADMKNRTIGDNISNSDTPGYKAKDVEFKDVLQNAMETTDSNNRTHEKHIDFSSRDRKPFQVQTKKDTMYNHNGNNVDIDKEMASLSKNQIYYEGLVDRLNGKFSDIQNVLQGGN